MAATVEVQVPGSINKHLRPYQREGVEFLFTKYADGTGGVLADDMGLVGISGGLQNLLCDMEQVFR
jgi:hypothetical protein